MHDQRFKNLSGLKGNLFYAVKSEDQAVYFITKQFKLDLGFVEK